MFARYVYERSSAAYEKHVLLIDTDSLEEKSDYLAYFKDQGFHVIRYENDLLYRVNYEQQVKESTEKFVMIASPGVYIPYDVLKSFRKTEISVGKLFPKLNSQAVLEENGLDYNLLTMAYRRNFSDLSGYQDTKEFLERRLRDRGILLDYLSMLCEDLDRLVHTAKTYQDWFAAARAKADIHVLAEQYGLSVDIDRYSAPFVDYILANYGKLSAEMSAEAPILVSRAMEFMADHSKKFVIIVMDGMSLFDWRIISRSFADIHYREEYSMAMIPTITSISRQCLLSDKFPVELESPWNQSKEKKEFENCARKLGYSDAQIGYERGYDADFGPAVRCAAIIINDVDDMVHGQLQGRRGMYNDINVLTEQHKLADTVRRMIKHGFDVYISADHGNTPCTGMGKLVKTGVETETRSHRMIVLKDFADKSGLFEKYGEDSLIEFPGYYLDKQFKYLICGIGKSFDAKGEEVMTHGGITLDEVIVPFIEIKAVDNNG